MARIAILARNLASADAVSNDALGMSRLLRARGHEVQLFAHHWSLPEHQVRHSSAALAFLQNKDDVLIYHHSIGWDSGVDILRQAKCRTIVKYHNVTPAEFFEGISAQHRDLCRQGRLQLTAIARAQLDLYLAASAYNLNELVVAGANDSSTYVVPPFNKIDTLQTTIPDLAILDKYADGKTNLLMVGGIRPNKGHVDLLEAFATYYYHYDCNCRLFIVGVESDAFEIYSLMLKKLAETLCLDTCIVFTGEASLEALKAYYLLSHAFLMLSEHEGFCVPLVEAMAMKLPIVAYGSAAIPETARDVGFVWSDRDPFLIAESVDFLVHNEEASVALGVKGHESYQERFSNEVIERQFLEATTAAGICL